jgi:hypothetical protein
VNIVFHNPHALWFKTNISCYYSRTKSISKYDFLFDYIYGQPPKVKVLIDDSNTASLFRGFLSFLNSPILDFYAWVFLNRLNPFRFLVIKNAKSLTKQDIIFSFIYGPFTHVNNKDTQSISSIIIDFYKSKAFKVVHLTHYGYNPKTASLNTKLAGIDLFVSESNLSKNSPFFRFFFNWYKNGVFILPFVPQDRFQSNKPFSERLNKAVSTGTNTHRISEEGFISFFKNDILHPMRKNIFDNKESLKPYIDSQITNINNSSKNLNNDGLLAIQLFISKYFIYPFKFIFGDFYRFLIFVFKYVFFIEFNSLKNERAYYKFNIVDCYNNYKMFIVPEEVIGLPGIGFVEGMACGCAYIGLNDPMYNDLGLIDKVHYIGYDGTINDLISKIEYYQNHESELEVIAKNGYEFAKNNFNEKKVAREFFEKIYSQALKKIHD